MTERDVLLFRLGGPMAGFGAPAVGEQRPAAPAPTRSAIVGLLGAAIGLRREDTQALRRLHETLGFAVRVDRPGAPMRDFHTAQAPAGAGFGTRAAELRARPLNTVLSDRGYQAEAAYSIALWARPAGERPLESLSEALRAPRFVLYLGRKGCPLAAPPRPRLLKAASLSAAFKAYDDLAPPLASEAPSAPQPAIFADAEADWPWPDTLADLRTQRDGPRFAGGWLFETREEGRVVPEPPPR